MNTNLKSAFLLSQAAGAHMLPRRRGSIIHFASLLSFQGGLTVPAYAAAKGGIAQMVKALANEWSKENVRVNAVVPGYIKTDMWVWIPGLVELNIDVGGELIYFVRFCRNEKLFADATRLRQISERIPAGRWGDPADFAGPIVFLASKASQYVCGELLVVDGVSRFSLSFWKSLFGSESFFLCFRFWNCSHLFCSRSLRVYFPERELLASLGFWCEISLIKKMCLDGRSARRMGSAWV